MVFTIFCGLIEKSKFWLGPLTLLTNFENLYSNPLTKI
jgi:hypothetical protein